MFGCAHDWGWPRRRDERDVQVCTKCGAERESEIQFAGSQAGQHVRRPCMGCGTAIESGERTVSEGSMHARCA
jgi:hypothetical protein